MSLIVRAKRFVDELEDRQVYQYVLAIVGCFVLVMGLLFYLHYNRIQKLQQEFRKISKDREKAKLLLARHAVVEQRKLQVDEVLGREKAFYIKEYFEKLIAELNLTAYSPKIELMSQDLQNNYSEVKLEATLSGINMQQLVELVYRIEKDDRLYTKELVINKAPQRAALDVKLVIATLQRQTGGS